MKFDTGTNDEIGVAVESWLYIYSLEKVPLFSPGWSPFYWLCHDKNAF